MALFAAGLARAEGTGSKFLDALIHEADKPWGAISKRVDEELARTCGGPAIALTLPMDRVVRSATDTETFSSLSVSASGVIALSDRHATEAIVFPDGLDNSTFAVDVRGPFIVDEVVISPDSRFLAWPSGFGVAIFDLKSRRPVATPSFYCHLPQIQWLDGKVLVACPRENLNRILEPSDGGFREARAFAVFPTDGRNTAITDETISHLAVPDTAGRVFLRGDQVYRDLDAVLADGAKPTLPAAEGRRVWRVGERLLQLESGVDADEPASLVLRDGDSGRVLLTRKLASFDCVVSDIALTPDGRTVALLLSSNVVIALRAEDLTPMAAYSLRRKSLDLPRQIAFLPNGQLVSLSGRELVVYDLPQAPR